MSSIVCPASPIISEEELCSECIKYHSNTCCSNCILGRGCCKEEHEEEDSEDEDSEEEEAKEAEEAEEAEEEGGLVVELDWDEGELMMGELVMGEMVVELTEEELQLSK